MKRREKYFLISLFVIFLVILILSPISGDDWGNYLVGQKGIRYMIGQAIGMYFDWEGRFVSRLFINLLTYHKWLWNIINSFLIVSIIYFTVKIINPKNKKVIYLLSFFSIVLMNIYTFSQSVTWIAGNITYLFPLALLIMYIYYLKTNINSDNFKFLLTILNFILPMFVVHIAVLLVIVNLFCLIYKCKRNKKIDKVFLIYLLVSIISTLIMILSPGTRYRNSVEDLDFNKLSLIEKVFHNLPNFIYYTFIINNYLLILFIIAMVYLINKTLENKVIKCITTIYVTIFSILTIIGYNLSFLDINIELVNPNNIFVILYWGSFTLIYLYLLIKNLNQKDYKFILLLSILGFSSNSIMLISPTWGYRTSFATYILLILSLLFIISKIKLSKKIEKFLFTFSILTTLVYFILYINIYIENKEREQEITKSINNNAKTIEIKKLPFYGPCNINPTSEYHIKVFKKYYNIDSDVIVILENR